MPPEKSILAGVNLLRIQYSLEEVAARQEAVRNRLLREAVRIREGNFLSLVPADLLTLFRLYDEAFFSGELGAEVLRQSGAPLKLRVSKAMTHAGGKTTQFRRRTLFGRKVFYEITISSRLLLCSFEEGGRAITVSGLSCRDRLDALQRIMEHEIIHLAEWLCFGNTSCARTRFMTLAQRIFGHRKRYHELVTLRERAARRYDLSVGDRVRFSFQGQPLCGTVNRIGVRATVLVEHADGQRYSDGRHYRKYYVPLAKLSKQARPSFELST